MMISDIPPDDVARSFAPLSTERLTLRPLRADDADPLHRLINDWAVVRCLETLPFPYPRELADSWIDATHESLNSGSAYHLAIAAEEDGSETLIGAVGLRLTGSKTASIGYWIGRPYWGHGLASEASGKIARWALANLDINKITATCAADNAASASVLSKIGMRQTGKGTSRFLARGGEHAILLFEMTREDVAGLPSPTMAPPVDVPPDASSSVSARQAELKLTAATPATKLVLVSAAALIDADGRVLLARRPEGKALAGLWEFPGGKMEPGETPEAALIRELKEELGIDVSQACLAAFAFASHNYGHFHLLMPLFLCRRWQGTPQGRENQALAWVRPDKLSEYPMPPADAPLIPLLRDFL